MADLSLDDYIQQKGTNFNVQIRNQNAGLGGKTRGTDNTWGKGNMAVGSGQRDMSDRRQGRGIVQLNKSPQTDTIYQSGLVTSNNFDARDKIVSRKRPLDARLKLDTKVRDARKTLTRMRLQKGTLDARALIKIKHKNENVPDINKSADANGNLPIDCIITQNPSFQTVGTVFNPMLMSDGGLQITRSVDTNVRGMSGNNFQITKNIIAHSQPIVSQSPEYLQKPQLIQICNDQYRSQLQPQISVGSSFDDYEQNYNNEYEFDLEQEATFITPITHVATSAPVIRAPAIGLTRHIPINSLIQNTFRQMGPLQIQKPTVVARKPPALMSVNTSSVRRKALASAEPLIFFRSGPLKFPNTVPSTLLNSGPLKLAGSGQKLAKTSAARKIPPKKIKLIEEMDDDDVGDDFEMDEITEQPDISVLSPQGYRVMITNLHTTVTQDDIVELFGCIGSVKRAKLMKPGVGEVVYMKKEDALAAVQKYHNRELDEKETFRPLSTEVSSSAKPMHVKLASSAKVKGDALLASDNPSGEPLRLAKPLKGQVTSESKSSVDISLLHRALFKTASGGLPSKPVKFTVKI